MRAIRFCLLSLLLSGKGDALCTSSSGAASTRHVRSTTLRLADSIWGGDPDLQNDLQSTSSKGMKGYYRRPSRAIEKGGGFFVPGLEGEKIRIVSASIILMLFVINRLGVDTSTLNSANLQLIVTEFTGILITIVLFLQGFLAVYGAGGSGRGPMIDGADTVVKASYISVLQSQKTESNLAAIETIARTLIQTCADVVYVSVAKNRNDNNEIIFEMGPVNCKSINRQYLENVFSKYTQIVPSCGSLLVEDLAVFNKSGEGEVVLEGSGGLVGTVVDANGLLWVLRTSPGSTSSGLQSNAKWIEEIIACPS